MRRSCARVCLAALLLSGLMQGCALSPAGGRVRPIQGISDRTWRDESIYLIMIDRFRDGDPTNDQGVNRSNPSTWHGGDLAGVIEKLDARSAAAEQAVVLLNNDPDKPWAAELDVTAAGLKDGTVLQDVLGAGQEATVTGGKLSVGVGPRSGAIYVVKHRG